MHKSFGNDISLSCKTIKKVMFDVQTFTILYSTFCTLIFHICQKEVIFLTQQQWYTVCLRQLIRFLSHHSGIWTSPKSPFDFFLTSLTIYFRQICKKCFNAPPKRPLNIAFFCGIICIPCAFNPPIIFF